MFAVFTDTVYFGNEIITNKFLDVLPIRPGNISLPTYHLNDSFDFFLIGSNPTDYQTSIFPPFCSKTKLTMYIIIFTPRSVETCENLIQHLFHHHSPGYITTPQLQIRVPWLGSYHSLGLYIMRHIMAIGFCHRQRHRQSMSTPTRTSDPLLIIKTLWRDIPHHYSRKGTDVYSGFHSRRDT